MTGCDEIRDRLLAYHEGELGAEERYRLEAHLAVCAPCSREAGLLREALGRVHTLPVPEPSADFWEAFGASLRRRLAKERPPRPSPWGRLVAWLGGFSSLRPVPALAAATAMGLLLAIGLLRAPRGPRDLPPAEALVVGQDLAIAQDLELLEQLDLLEEVEVLERLPLLRRLDAAPRPRLG